MAVVSMKQLLEAGVHFGHQTRRWNPKMKKYIYTERNDIHIIDLQQTLPQTEVAYKFVRDIARRRQTRAVCRHQKAGSGSHQDGSGTLRNVLHQQPLAWRHTDKLQNNQIPYRKTQQNQPDGKTWRTGRSAQERSCQNVGRKRQTSSQPRRHQGYEGNARLHLHC